jgi:hypothetical protein
MEQPANSRYEWEEFDVEEFGGYEQAIRCLGRGQLLVVSTNPNHSFQEPKTAERLAELMKVKRAKCYIITRKSPDEVQKVTPPATEKPPQSPPRPGCRFFEE